MGLSNSILFRLPAKVGRCQTYRRRTHFFVVAGVRDYIIYHINKKNATQISLWFPILEKSRDREVDPTANILSAENRE